MNENKSPENNKWFAVNNVSLRGENVVKFEFLNMSFILILILTSLRIQAIDLLLWQNADLQLPDLPIVLRGREMA